MICYNTSRVAINLEKLKYDCSVFSKLKYFRFEVLMLQKNTVGCGK